MQLTKQQVETILKNAPAGTDKVKILDGLINRGYELEGVDTVAAKQDIAKRNAPAVPTAPPAETKPTLVQDYNADAKDAFDNAGKRIVNAGDAIVETVKDPNLNVAEKVVGVGSNFFKGIGQFIGGGAIDIVKTLVPQSVEDYIGGKVEDVAAKALATKPVQDLATWYAQLTPEERKSADNALGYAEGLSELLAVKGSGKLASKLLEIGEQNIKRGAAATQDAAVATKDAIGAAATKTADAVGDATAGIRNAAGEVIPSADRIVNYQVSRALDLTAGDIKNINLSTGREVGEFLADKNLIRGNKAETTKALEDFFDANYKSVRVEIGKVTTVYKQADVPRYKQALTEIQKQVGETSGLEEVAKELNTLLKKKNIVLNDVQRVKELLDEHFSLYKMTGDVKEGVTKKGLSNLRKELKEFIEKEVEKSTGADIRGMNTDVSVAKSTLHAIAARATKGLTSTNIHMNDFGTFGIGALFGGPLTGTATVVAKKLLESSTVRLKIAKWLDGISDARKLKLKESLLEGDVPEEVMSIVETQSKSTPKIIAPKTNINKNSISNTITQKKGKVKASTKANSPSSIKAKNSAVEKMIVTYDKNGDFNDLDFSDKDIYNEAIQTVIFDAEDIGIKLTKKEAKDILSAVN